MQKQNCEIYNRHWSVLFNKLYITNYNPTHCCHDLPHFQLLPLNCNSDFTRWRQPASSLELSPNKTCPFWLEWDWEGLRFGLIVVFSGV